MTTDRISKEGPARRSGRTVRMFGRSVTVGRFSGLVVCLAGLLVATLGVVAVGALSGSSRSSNASHGTRSVSSRATSSLRPKSSRSRRSSTSAPAPTQADAPDFPTQGGAQNGYGNFNAVSCASSSTCFAVGADNSGNGIASTSSNGGATWTSSTLPSGTPDAGSVRNSV